MKLAQVGEFGLIDRIQRLIVDGSPDVVLGIGDDAAVLCPQEDRLILFTTDALVEGIHFNLRYSPFESLGWKALAINISDIVAMGGIPRHGVVSLALPATWKVEDVESLYRGLRRCGETYDCVLVGGDTARSPDRCCITVSVIGEVEEEKVKTRKGAQEGELLCVTGELGGARVGWEVLESDTDRGPFLKAVNRFLEPKVLLREAQELITELNVTSMIDISDGLASEVGHICRQSGLGCILWEEKVPVAEETVVWADRRGESIAKYIFTSGEEYELLFTVNKDDYERWKATQPTQTGLNVTIVGEMVNRDKGIHVKRGGEIVPLSSFGWDHFHQ